MERSWSAEIARVKVLQDFLTVLIFIAMIGASNSGKKSDKSQVRPDSYKKG
jgi:hypothetical protein